MNKNTAFLILPLFITGVLHGQVVTHAGLWETTVTGGGKTATRSACITPEQEQQSKGTVESMRAATEKSLATSGGCKLAEFTIAGSTQTVVTVCDQITIKHVTIFHGDSFETTATTTTPEGPKTASIKGHRLGNCPPSGAK